MEDDELSPENVATFVPIQQRKKFAEILQGQNKLVSPVTTTVVIDPGHHDANRVRDLTKQELSAILLEEADRCGISSWATSKGFIFPRTEHQSAEDRQGAVNGMKMLIDCGMGPSFSAKGVTVRITDRGEEDDDRDLLFIELSRSEDEAIIKESKRPMEDKRNIHIQSDLRMQITPDNKHFVCCAEARSVASGSNPHAESLDKIAREIRAKPSISTGMLQALLRMVNGSGAGGCTSKRKRSAEHEEAGDEPSKKIYALPQDDEKLVALIEERFCSMHPQHVRDLMSARMRKRSNDGDIDVPDWVKCLFICLRKSNARGACDENQTLQEILGLDTNEFDSLQTWKGDFDRLLQGALGVDRSLAELHKMWLVPLKVLGIY